MLGGGVTVLIAILGAVAIGARRGNRTLTEQERTERISALLDDEGRHLLLAGDPVAPAEVLAAPSAPTVDVAICLLDIDEDCQRERLRRRGDPEELLPRHVAFADWLRHHARDPRHMPHVLTTGGWSGMRGRE
jgi:hypothetical protein